MPLPRQIIAALGAAFVVAGCGDAGTGPRPPVVASIAIEGLVDTVRVGETLQLTARARAAGDAVLPDVAVAWRSLTPLVASIDSAGRLVALDSGDASLVARAHGRVLYEDTIIVPVRPPVPPVVTAIAVAGLVDTADVGDTLQLTGRARGEGDVDLAGIAVAWTSLTPALATIDVSGRLVALDTGDATIVASARGRALFEDTLVVPVRRLVRGITLSARPADSLGVGGFMSFQATPRDRYGATMTAPVTWRSTDTTVLKVTNGNVEARGAGTAWIRAQAGAVSDSVALRAVVFAHPAAGLSLVTISVAQDGTACGLTRDGTGYCWGGSNGSGQQGAGDQLPSRIARPIAGNHRWREISMGQENGCGIDTDDVAWCWGRNSHFAAGIGTSQPSRLLEPVRVATTVRFADIVASHHMTGCATAVADSILYCWGHNDFGQTGHLNPAFEPSTPTEPPVRVRATLVEASGFHGCAIATDTSTWCWGEGYAFGVDSGRVQPRQVLPAGTFAQLALGMGYTCGLDAAGQASCYGTAVAPAPGDTTRSARAPRPVLTDLRFKRISAALDPITCGVSMDDEAWCWGMSSTTSSAALTPWRHPRLQGRAVRAIDLSMSGGCAITQDDEAICW